MNKQQTLKKCLVGHFLEYIGFFQIKEYGFAIFDPKKYNVSGRTFIKMARLHYLKTRRMADGRIKLSWKKNYHGRKNNEPS